MLSRSSSAGQYNLIFKSPKPPRYLLQEHQQKPKLFCDIAINGTIIVNKLSTPLLCCELASSIQKVKKRWFQAKNQHKKLKLCFKFLNFNTWKATNNCLQYFRHFQCVSLDNSFLTPRKTERLVNFGSVACLVLICK